MRDVIGWIAVWSESGEDPFEGHTTYCVPYGVRKAVSVVVAGKYSISANWHTVESSRLAVLIEGWRSFVVCESEVDFPEIFLVANLCEVELDTLQVGVILHLSG